MELKKLYLTVDLVGYWHNSFDNNYLFTTAENLVQPESPDYDTAEAFAFIVLDENLNITNEAIAVSFKQDGDNVILGYRMHRFTVLSANRFAVVFSNGFATYKFQRPANHILYKGV